MTLQDLRTYFRLREYQISHLLNAQQFFKLYCKGKNFDHQMWLYLFYWADAMHQADEMAFSDGFERALTETSRGHA